MTNNTPKYKYGRNVRLLIESDDTVFDLSDFRITFQVIHACVSTPKTLTCRIYNLSHGGKNSRNTVAEIQSAKNKFISLSAWYDGEKPKRLFYGQVRQIYAGRESPTDTYLNIRAYVLAEMFAMSSVKNILAKGWTYEQAIKNVLGNVKGLKVGKYPNKKGSGSRPKVVYGNTRDIIRGLAQNFGSIPIQNDDGTISFIEIGKLNQPIKGNESIFVTTHNGLIGIPLQIPEGVQATCLMEPRIELGGTIDIYSKNDNDTRTMIQQEDVQQGYGQVNSGNQITDNNGLDTVMGLDYNGKYNVIYVDHFGDTRGTTWYTTFIGQALDASQQAIETTNAAGSVATFG